MSQCAQIFCHLQDHGTITPLQAFALFGTLALHSRIAELRERGIEIECNMIELPNGKRVGQYSLPLKVAYG